MTRSRSRSRFAILASCAVSPMILAACTQPASFASVDATGSFGPAAQSRAYTPASRQTPAPLTSAWVSYAPAAELTRAPVYEDYSESSVYQSAYRGASALTVSARSSVAAPSYASLAGDGAYYNSLETLYNAAAAPAAAAPASAATYGVAAPAHVAAPVYQSAYQSAYQVTPAQTAQLRRGPYDYGNYTSAGPDLGGLYAQAASAATPAVTPVSNPANPVESQNYGFDLRGVAALNAPLLPRETYEPRLFSAPPSAPPSYVVADAPSALQAYATPYPRPAWGGYPPSSAPVAAAMDLGPQYQEPQYITVSDVVVAAQQNVPPIAPPAPTFFPVEVAPPQAYAALDAPALPPLAGPRRETVVRISSTPFFDPFEDELGLATAIPAAPGPLAYAQRSRLPAPRPYANARAYPTPRGGVQIEYRVSDGDTLYRIARRYGVTPQDIARLNGIFDPRSLRAGQTLRMPQGARPPAPGYRPVQPERAAAQPEWARPSWTRPSWTRQAPPPVRTQFGVEPARRIMPMVPASRPVPTAAPERKFHWPSRGDVFAASVGVDIRARRGSDVRAAAAGVIAHVGMGPRGAQVVIDHGDGWRTVYLGIARPTARVGQRVEELGSLGSVAPITGGSLHFELRRFDQPVDLTRYMIRG